MWDLPGPGLEPASPALAGRFLTTAPPGKYKNSFSFDRTLLFSLAMHLKILFSKSEAKLYLSFSLHSCLAVLIPPKADGCLRLPRETCL